MTPFTAIRITGAALACCSVAAGQAHAAAPPQATVKVVSASVPNGTGDRINVKVAYTFPSGDPLVRVATSGPPGAGSATGQATAANPLSVVVAVQASGTGRYASGTPVAVSVELAGESGTAAVATRTVTPS